MKKLMLTMIVLLSLGLMVGCGGSDAEQTEQAEQVEQVEPAADVQVATHDCDGGCGMTDMPVDQTVEYEGKYYCKGCATKVVPAEETHDEHDGHTH